MAWKIIWSEKAKQNIRDIHAYWIERTGSDAYPAKLEEVFFEVVDNLEHNPFLGIATMSVDKIRFLIVKYYKVAIYNTQPKG